MPIIYHYPLSTGSRFVRLILGEYGETATLIEQTPWERHDDLLALNPAGTLPVMVDDDQTVISGAPVIGEYLLETRGGRLGENVLMPATPAGRAEARRLVDWFLEQNGGRSHRLPADGEGLQAADVDR